MTIVFRDRHDYSEVTVEGASRCEYEIVTRGRPLRFWKVTKTSGDVVRYDKSQYNIITIAD